MTAQQQPLSSRSDISDQSLRRIVFSSVLMTMLLTPLIGSTIMGMMGVYPMPEIYLVFISYSSAYVAVCVVLALLFASRATRYLIKLTTLETAARERQVARVLRPLPIYLFLAITIYSIGGATSANISLQSMGYAEYSLRDYLFSYFGLIPVVLITAFAIFFYFSDYLGRYLAPRGFHLVAIPLWVKIVMLGLVTPILIDTVLITYFVNRTGQFDLEMFGMWLLLLLLAAIGTALAMGSLNQGLTPLQDFLSRQRGLSPDKAELIPQSIDELGSLTGELAELLEERQRISEALKKERNFIDAVVDNAGALLVVLDAQGRISSFNQACEELTGYDEEQVVGHYIWDLFLVPEEAKKIRSEAFEALVNNPQAGVGRYINDWLVKDDARRTIEWKNTLLHNEAGRVDFIVSIGTDVTEQIQAMEALRRSEEQLRQLNETLEARVAERTKALQDSNRELEAYSYSIAHDLRAPLRTIVSFSQIVLMDAQDKLAEEEISHLQRVVNGGQLMAQLIDEILALARVSRQEITSESLDLSAIAREVIEQLQQTEPQRQVEIAIEAGLRELGDPQLVRLLLTNLLGNAWKYTRNQARGCIEFRRVPEHTSVAYMVRDNGVGFDMSHTKHLFHPFYRLHAQDQFEGAGVGLATAHRIVQRHNGRIWAEGKPDKGATFYFTLDVTQILPTANEALS